MTACCSTQTRHVQGVDLHPRRGRHGDISFEKLVVLVVLFVAVVVGVIAITKSQRRIPTQSAKHVRGRRVYGGTRQFLPLKVNQAGVMPIIFASSLLIFPSFIFNSLASADRRAELGRRRSATTCSRTAAGWHLQRPATSS